MSGDGLSGTLDETATRRQVLWVLIVGLVSWFILWRLVPAGVNAQLGLVFVSLVTLVALVVVIDSRNWWRSPGVWFAVAAGLIFFVRPLVDLIDEESSYQLNLYIGATYEQALEMGALGIMSFTIGYAWLGRGSRPLHHPRRIDVDEKRFNRGAILVVVVSVLLTSVFVTTSGGLGVFLGGRTDRTAAALEASSGYLYSAPQWIFPIGLYYIVASYRGGTRLQRVFGIALVAGSQGLSILLGSRSYFLIAALACTLAVLISRSARPRLLVAVGLIPLVVYLGIIVPRLYRTSDSSEGSVAVALDASLNELGGSDWYKFLQSDDFAMARNLALALRVVPEKTGFGFGETYLAAAVRPLPRQLFAEDKPPDVDSIINARAIYPYRSTITGYSYSYVSEPFYNFGYFGVIGFSVGLGLVLRSLRNGISDSQSKSAQYIVYYSVVVASLLVFVRGNLGTDYQRLLFFILPLWFVVLYGRADATRGL